MQTGWRSLTAFLVCAVFVSPGLAQNDPGTTILQEKLRQQQEQRLQRSQHGFEIELGSISGPVEETVCFQIDEIILRGVTAFSTQDLEEIISRFTGECLGQVSIDLLLRGISAQYAENGFITSRAYVSEQDISSGKLFVDVIEGRVEKFLYQQVDKNETPKSGKPRKIKTAFPMKTGDVLQLRAIEHGLENMNRLSSSQARVNIVPGNTPGTSVVVIQERKMDSIRGMFSLDNNSSEDQGNMRMRFDFEADDILDLNEAVSISYVGTVNTNALAGSFSIPYQNWLFSSYGSYSESLSLLTPTSDLFSQNESLNTKAERLLFRNARTKLFAYASLHSFKNERYINISSLTPQKRSALRVGVRHEHHMKDGIIFADTSIAVGTKFFNADWNSDIDSSDIPRTEYTKLETQISYLKLMGSGRQFKATAFGQIANVPLYSNEQLSFGGWETVRGFAGNGVAGDSGLYIRSEYSFQKLVPDVAEAADSPSSNGAFGIMKNGIYRSYLFLDAGTVRDKAAGNSSSIVGLGFGIDATFGRLTFRVAGAVPVLQQRQQKEWGFQGLVNVSYRFF